MKLTQLALAGLGSAALFTMTSAKAQVFADWTFESDTVATNNTPVADTGIDGKTANGGNNSATAAGLGMTNSDNGTTSVNTDDVLQGVTSGGKSDTGANGISDGGLEWRVRGQSPGNGWSSQAAIGTQGAEFSASTVGASAGASAITVTFDFYETSAGEANMEFLYSTNGGTTWTNLALNIPTADVGLTNKTGSAADANTVNGAYVSASGGQNWFQGLSATITDPNALNDSGFEIEMVNASTGADDITASDAAENGTSGNWRFDNIEIQAVPEPSSWLLSLTACGMLVALRRTRRSSAK
ncbi:MAG TPA: PEP-CTERM sorting domain-containing protein [Candidatus Methylacidiphilales bacterium]|jgi:hypothetical protein|nr:PEP-CTERM sorting domain-containing protein [Candidatus Methylacidiphilales bacterium]